MYARDTLQTIRTVGMLRMPVRDRVHIIVLSSFRLFVAGQLSS